MNHVCKESQSCSCSLSALEPDEYCPKHGGCLYTYPPKCEICGRFIKQNKKNY